MTDTSETWPSPEYENDKVNAISGVTEFTNDVYVYGKLYADVFGSTTGDANLDLSGSDLSINNLLVSGVSTFYGPVDMDYLTVYQRFNVGASGTVFTAISTSTEYTTGNRVGIGTTQPVTFFQVGVADTSFVVTNDGLVGIGTTQPDGKFQVGDNYFTITDKGGIGIGTTQPDGKFQIGDECLTVRVDPCRVGIGTTLPDAKFQVGYREKSIAFASDPITGVTSVGIGTTQPYQRLQVGERDDSFVVTETGIVGIGSTDPGNIPGYSSSEGELRLNVEGTVKIDRNIIDSADSIGANGYYLNRDGRGIRWVQASPISLDGMFVQDEGVDLPVGGTAQLFQWLNFTQINSQGTGIDNLIPIPDPANPTAIAKIQTQDFWGYTGSDIYRMTKVGIKNSSPSYDLDITGTLHATQDVQFDAQLTVDGNTLLKGTLTVNQATDLDSTLNVDGATTLNSTLDVDGATTLNSTLDVDGGTTLNSTLDVDGATTLNNTLDVDGQATFNDGTDSSSPTTGSVQIDGGLGIVKKLYVGNDATIQGTTESTTKDTGALVVEGGAGIEKNVNIGGALKVDSTTVSTDCTTGSGIFAGGVGIQGDLNVCGDEHIFGTTESTTKDTGALIVEGGVGIEKKLNVGGITKVWDQTDTTSKDTGALIVEGGVGIEKKLFVGSDTDTTSKDTGALVVEGGVGIEKKLFVGSDTESTTKDTGALIVEGGVGIEKKLNVGDDAKIWGNTESDDKDTGALVVDGGVGIEKKLNVGDDAKIWGNTQSDDKDTGALVVEGGVGIERNLNVGENTKLIGTLELENHIIDYFNNNGVGICKTDYRLSSFNVGGVGAGVSWRPSGVQTKRTIWVTKNGCDTNSGLLEGDAKHTIGAAAEIAQEGDTIKVRSGIYVEDNPIGLRNDVAVSGEDLRLVTLIPKNTNKDFFHVRRGCLVENLSFSGETLATTHVGCGAVAFPPTQASINAGTDFQAVNGYTSVGPANEGASGRWKSPYVRNCTNFMTASVGMKINGDHANANFSGTNNLGQDIKSMVCDSFTQYNESGIGVSLTNNAYAQLVSIFTIGCDKGIYCDTGGQCDLTNSNSSFGNFGLFSNGYGAVEFDGVMQTTSIAESDVFEVTNVRDFNSPRQFRTPFDGQGVYFHLDMNDFEDTPATGTITQPLELVRSLKITNGGNPGEYSSSAPPIITISEGPLGPEGILPEFSPNVSAAGTITSIDVINSGRNYLPTQNLILNIPGSATADIDMDPILYTVSEATGHDNVGFTAITMNEFIPYEVKLGTKVELVRLSRIITSSHSFEYIGAGVDLNTANPFQGGKPIPENEVVAINGGQCPFTSTDQKGNFRIGDGLTIDQTTSTIRGRDFNRAIQAQLTPLILALR